MAPAVRKLVDLFDTLPALSDSGVALVESCARVESGVRATPLLADDKREEWAGKKLDHFEIEQPLARGGMGAVYRARDTSLDRTVAVKLLLDELAERPELQERFIREARAQARLNSPHVAQIYYVGRTRTGQGQPMLFLAMEYVDGGTLEELTNEQEPLDPELARQLMLQVTRGLLDAEANGVIHRDIKPSNLLLDRSGTVKIADFGVAKVARDADLQLTQSGALVGSPLYMAPEQARGEAIDHRADMYSLGCTFYHLISGRPPFEANNAVGVIAAHLTREATPLRKLSSSVPAPLSAIIARLMNKRPEQRFASYAELIDALEAAAPEQLQNAGFWARAAAVTIDLALAGCAVALLGWAGLLVHLAYVTVAQARWGQTVGKYLLNIRVQRSDGRRLGFARSVARTLSSMWLPFLIGCMVLTTEGSAELKSMLERLQPTEWMALRNLLIAIAIGNALLSLLYLSGLALAAFHPLKRAAHDLIVGSHVIYRLAPRDQRVTLTG